MKIIEGIQIPLQKYVSFNPLPFFFSLSIRNGLSEWKIKVNFFLFLPDSFNFFLVSVPYWNISLLLFFNELVKIEHTPSLQRLSGSISFFCLAVLAHTSINSAYSWKDKPIFKIQKVSLFCSLRTSNQFNFWIKKVMSFLGDLFLRK